MIDNFADTHTVNMSVTGTPEEIRCALLNAVGYWTSAARGGLVDLGPEGKGIELLRSDGVKIGKLWVFQKEAE